MMLLLLFVGAVFVYLVMFMAFLVALLGVCISLGVHALVYTTLLMWSKFRNRSKPEWKFERKLWKPDLEHVQAYSMVSGVLSFAFMVVGFIAYAITQDWGDTLGWTIGFMCLVGLIMYIHRDELNQDHHPHSKI